jgi:hypothetical protein
MQIEKTKPITCMKRNPAQPLRLRSSEVGVISTERINSIDSEMEKALIHNRKNFQTVENYDLPRFDEIPKKVFLISRLIQLR